MVEHEFRTRKEIRSVAIRYLCFGCFGIGILFGDILSGVGDIIIAISLGVLIGITSTRRNNENDTK